MWGWNRQVWEKIKGTTKCDKITVIFDIGIAQCVDGIVKCEKKSTKCEKKLSHLMLELHNVRMELSNVRKK